MPIITLLTDFGTRDSYVGEIRGVLLSRAPGVVLADISHEVALGDVRAAAYLLLRSWRAFPAGTVHLAVIDPDVGGARAALALRAEGHWFVGPDNGLFTPVLDRADHIVQVPVPPSPIATFHGRDVFAPAAAAIAAGSPLSELGPPLPTVPVRLPMPTPLGDGGRLAGEVVYIDRFGTLITNIGPDASGPIEIADVQVPLRRTFGDVTPGGLVAFVGSGGTIEIAVRDGSAAERFTAHVGIRVRAGARGAPPV
jgi:S-adenosyl-L-methionine hydrolase (adenosine-forming)